MSIAERLNMQEQSGKFVKNPHDLPTYQRRLRHVRSITLRNLQCKSYSGKDITKLQVYFTVHCDEKLKEFYKSEEIHGTLNPSWQSFDVSRFEEEIDIQAKLFVLRIWVKNGAVKAAQPHLLVDWTIHLSGLVFFSDKLQHDKYKYTPNMVVVGMFDKYFIAPQTPMSPDCDVLCLEPGTIPRNSYTINSLSRIYTVLRAITQTQASVKRVHRCIEDKLLDSREKTRKCSQREDLLLRISQMKNELTFQMNKLQHQRDVSDNCRKAREEKSHAHKERLQQLQKNRADYDEMSKAYFQTRETYIKENYQLLIRRKQLINELTTYIYPITELRDRRLCICGVHLPNSEDFERKDETMCAVALGYSCHLVSMMSQILCFPVRYPMALLSSQSTITDHIHPKLTDRDKTFPLYLKGKDKFQFNYGVFLLNKNISQLRFYCGLGTTDLRTTLPNIKSLLETKLGIKMDGMDKSRFEIKDSMSVVSGDPEGTASSLTSRGKNSALNQGEAALDRVLSNGVPEDNGSSFGHVHSPVPLGDSPVSKENIPGDGVEHSRTSGKNFLGLQPAQVFGADSADNSSNGSFQEISNGAISYDRDFSLSPSPGKTDNNLAFLNPVFPVPQSGSPTSLTDDSSVNSPSVELKDGNSTDIDGAGGQVVKSPSLDLNSATSPDIEMSGNSVCDNASSVLQTDSVSSVSDSRTVENRSS